jgi:hypothetical protein
MIAAERGFAEVVNLLLQCPGIDVNQQDNKVGNFIITAVFKVNLHIVLEVQRDCFNSSGALWRFESYSISVIP